MDYNKHPIVTLGFLKADIRSAGWEAQEVTFLLNYTPTLKRKEKFLKFSKHQNGTDNMKSRHSCYSNQKGQQRAKLDRNENVPSSRLSNFQGTLPQNSSISLSQTIQSENSQHR